MGKKGLIFDNGAAELRHVTTVWVKALFHPSKRTTIPCSRGRIGTRVNCLTKMTRFSPYRRSL
jgi:hypothetical protein